MKPTSISVRVVRLCIKIVSKMNAFLKGKYWFNRLFLTSDSNHDLNQFDFNRAHPIQSHLYMPLESRSAWCYFQWSICLPTYRMLKPIWKGSPCHANIARSRGFSKLGLVADNPNKAKQTPTTDGSQFTMVQFKIFQLYDGVKAIWIQ